MRRKFIWGYVALVVLTTVLSVSGQPSPPTNVRIPPDPNDRRTLSVNKTGTGSGTITGPGITCGTDCSENYIVDTTTVIFANPTAGSTFSGWSGACTGSGACTVTMDAAKSVTATFTLSGGGGGTIRTAASCNYADVNTQVTASANGDTVIVPGGLCVWSSELSPANKYITLKGNGGLGTQPQCATPGQTTYTCIQRGTAAARIINWYTIEGPVGTVSRITGFTFIGPSVAVTVNQHKSLIIGGVSGRFRLDDNYFWITEAPFVSVENYVRGVADHNIYQNATSVNGTTTFSTTHSGWGGVTPNQNSHSSWGSPLTLGTSEAMYYEDNTISDAPLSADDGAGGSRVVHRYNTYNNTTISSGHGTETFERGRVQQEDYGNIVTKSSGTPLIGGRSGVHITFNNRLVTTLTGGNLIEASQFFRFTFPSNPPNYGTALVRRTTGITWSGGVATVTTTAPHFITFSTGSPAYIQIRGSSVAAFNAPGTNPWKVTAVPSSTTFQFALATNPGGNDTSGNAIVQSAYDAVTAPGLTGTFGDGAYPAMDLTCWGEGDLLTGGGSQAALPFGFPNQQLIGCMAWNNLRGTTLATATILVNTTNNSGAIFQENRDFWNQNTAASCNTAGGNCTAGIGRGPIASRPSQCSAANGGVGYVATDQGSWNTTTASENFILYRCRTTNTWTPWYGPNNSTGQPYTYPHPLTQIP